MVLTRRPAHTIAATSESVSLIDDRLEQVRNLVPTPRDVDRLLLTYRAALDEVITKLEILRDEFSRVHDDNPTEHISSRLKTLDSIIDKATRTGCPLTIDAIRHSIHDIAGVRVVCSFTSDVYRLFHLVAEQADITVVEMKDYIARPKPSGYRSLHAILEIPVFLSTGAEAVTLELQIRTVAMDFWASLEHKIFYKYDGEVPDHLASELRGTATVAAQLDRRMQQLQREVAVGQPPGPPVANSQTAP